MYSWLDDATSADDTSLIVTASRRLARELRQIHSDRMLAAGAKSWPTPRIQYLGDWCAALIDNAPETGVRLRLSPNASNVLWERQLRDRQIAELPGFSGVVRQCRQTWQRLHEWRVPLDAVLSRASGPEQRLFAGAASEYQSILARERWVDDATILDCIASAFESGVIAEPSRIYLAGFDSINPAVRRIVDQLESDGTSVSAPVTIVATNQRTLYEFADRQSELRAAGAWARQHIEKEPNSRLAIICPDLASDAQSAARLVREGFVPGWQFGGNSYRASVNVSYGSPLAEYPAIAIALLLLRWQQSGLKSREISMLMRSRSIIGGSTAGRCRLETALRRCPDQQWSPANLLGALSPIESGGDADVWCQHMRHLATAHKKSAGNRSTSEWANHFDQLLTGAGWPGNTAPDSEQFQVINRWRELLNEFARLENVLPNIRYGEAVSRINSMATETIFQPEGRQHVLPVVGMLEAAGFEYDQLWVSGFDSTHWPGSGNPLSYISRQLQQDYGMPDSTPDETLAFSRRVAERLCGSASKVHFSWSLAAEGLEQAVSRISEPLELISADDVVDPGWFANTLTADSRVTMPDSDPVPAIGAKETVGGGAYTVQRQTVEPFSAFAFGRLRVSELQAFQPGLSASQRGSIIHQALKNLYSELPDQQQLRKLTKSDIAGRIDDAIGKAMDPVIWHSNDVLTEIAGIERLRLARMLQDFTDQELHRDPFKVAMVERALAFESCGVRLNLRVDRVDEIDDGKFFVIDYKSGAEKSLINRNGDLYDLQLIVYALAIPDPVAGVGIFNLDSRSVNMKSSAVGDEWDEQFAAWSATADAAIRSLAAGEAGVNILQGTSQGRALNVLSRFEELRDA